MQVLPVKYFGEELILYRTESGEARLTDAYCPHMKTHLAKNESSYIVLDGKVVAGVSKISALKRSTTLVTFTRWET